VHPSPTPGGKPPTDLYQPGALSGAVGVVSGLVMCCFCVSILKFMQHWRWGRGELFLMLGRVHCTQLFLELSRVCMSVYICTYVGECVCLVSYRCALWQRKVCALVRCEGTSE